MAITIAVETSPGSGVFTDLTAYLQAGSMTSKLNTLDLLLFDPPAGSLVMATSGPQRGVKLTDPAWVGTISAFSTRNATEKGAGHVFWAVTAINANSLPNDTAPFDLSDAPADTTTVYQCEDGSTMDLESGTDWADSTVDANLGVYETEGTKSRGYSNLSVQLRAQPGAANQTLGRFRTWHPGLRPGNQFKISNADQGYAAVAYQITQVTATWPGKSTRPVFAIEFGDTPQTLALWTQINAPAPAR